MITVVIPSFYSSHLVEERIKEIGNNVPVIIVENSRDFNLKKKIEKEFSNVKVLIPEENLGFGGAYNFGMHNSKTEFVFLIQPDILLIDNCINNLLELVKEFKDFSVLTPYDKNDKSWKNYEVYNNSKKEIKKNRYTLKEVDYVDLSWLINKKNFSREDFWDEKIFHYFEAADFAKRLRDKNKKIFVVMEINTYHIGAASHDKKLEFYSKLHRNWHYNWSRFYFNKKHFGVFYAYRKGLSLLFKTIFRLLKSVCMMKINDFKFILPELQGLFASMINKKSYYRPYEKINFFK